MNRTQGKIIMVLAILAALSSALSYWSSCRVADSADALIRVCTCCYNMDGGTP